MAETEAKEYRLVSYVSSRADVPPDLESHPNTMVMERVIVYPLLQSAAAHIWGSGGIGPFSRIGDHTWIVGPRVG